MDLRQVRKHSAQLRALHNRVDEPVLQAEFSRLEAFGQGLFDSVLNHATTGETDKRMRFGYDYIALHGKRCRHTTRSRIADDTEVRQAGSSMPFYRSADLGHLHQGNQALLHAGAARTGEDNERQSHLCGALHGAGDLLAHHIPHGAHHERGLHHGKRHGDAVQFRQAAAHALGAAALHTGSFDHLVEAGEVQRVALFHIGIPFRKALRIEDQTDTLFGSQAVQAAAFGAHAAIGSDIAHVAGNAAFGALAPQGIGLCIPSRFA